MSGVFICYRRTDSAGWVGRMADSLKTVFGAKRVFTDISDIEPGDDFVEAIEKTLDRSRVLLAVIGPHWLTVTGPNGQRRLDDQNDLLRREVARALERNLVVIPILVGRASMPLADDLPEDLEPLARREALRLSDKRWEHDFGRLVRLLRKRLGVSEPIGRTVLRVTVTLLFGSSLLWLELGVFSKPVGPSALVACVAAVDALWRTLAPFPRASWPGRLVLFVGLVLASGLLAVSTWTVFHGSFLRTVLELL